MKINLIAGPRNVSTALMYSFAQRRDMKVIDEPFYACYLSETGVDHPGKDEVLKAQNTDPTRVIVYLDQAATGAEHLFIKNMAHHLAWVPNEFLVSVRNIFLIRDPEEMLLSFIKKIPNPTLKDTAYQQQYELFQHTTDALQQSPIIIDSKELLKNPAAVLQRACARLDIPFDERMLCWQKGPIAADGVWAEHWYQNVHESTRFKPYAPKQGTLPDRLKPLLETCSTYYDELYAHAIKPES